MGLHCRLHINKKILNFGIVATDRIFIQLKFGHSRLLKVLNTVEFLATRSDAEGTFSTVAGFLTLFEEIFGLLVGMVDTGVFEGFFGRGQLEEVELRKTEFFRGGEEMAHRNIFFLDCFLLEEFLGRLLIFFLG
jgi:hypothetical protein